MFAYRDYRDFLKMNKMPLALAKALSEILIYNFLKKRKISEPVKYESINLIPNSMAYFLPFFFFMQNICIEN